MKHTRMILAATLVLPIGLAGCKGKAPNGSTARAPAAATEGSDEASRRAEVAGRVRETLQEMAFFDYDRSDLRPDARRVLDSKVTLLRNDPSIRLRIEGHADERGSDGYNMALGRRRAQAVRQYLTSRGVEAGRLDVTSFGERRPLASGRNEAAWSRNRRAEFVLVNSPR